MVYGNEALHFIYSVAHKVHSDFFIKVYRTLNKLFSQPNIL